VLILTLSQKLFSYAGLSYVYIRLMTHQTFVAGLLLRNFVAQQKLHVCHTLLQSLQQVAQQKSEIRTSSISLQLVAQTVNADWSILVYIQLFTY